MCARAITWLYFVGGDPEFRVISMEDFLYLSAHNISNISNTSNVLAHPSCVLGLLPCSITITGNLVLIVFYGILLAVAAKVISDGAEMLLDLGLPASLIGGIVLPLLGAVPDSAMIIASGVGGGREEANKQIAVGMGTLAGSTIMLLTLPWLGSIILGRVEIVRGEGKDGVRRKFTIKSFYKQGVTVFPDVTYSAIIMLVSALPYLVVQGADWHWGPSNTIHTDSSGSGQPKYIRDSALASFVLASILFFAYLVLQAFYSVSSKRKDELRRQEMIKRRVVKRMYLTSLGKFQSAGGGGVSRPATSVQTDRDETKPLLSSGKQKHFLGVWRNYRGQNEPDSGEAEKGKKENTNGGKAEESVDDPKWKIAIKSSAYLLVGVGMVTIFSDPMVGALTALTDSDNEKYHHSGGVFTKGQYIPIGVFYVSFVVTPLCSNASELVSSLMFAAKKNKINSSLTFSQLYGAATMNNTLGLGIFAALVYFRDLDWQYSAEVSVILFVEFAVGILGIIAGFGYRHTYILILGIFVGALYFFSILLIWILEKFAHWK